MFFQKKPGWAIAFRIIMVLVLIGGVVAITRGAFYMGYQRGAASEVKDLDGDFMFHDDWGTKGHYPQMRYPGGSYMMYRGFPGGSILPFLFILFGGIFLVKMIFGASMYRRGMKPGELDGKGSGMYPPHFYHHPHHWRHYGYHCDCGCEDEPEAEGKEPVDGEGSGEAADKEDIV